MKKLLCLTILILFCHTSFASEKLRFGFVPGVYDPFYKRLEKGIREKAEELNIEIITSNYPKYWGAKYQIPILKAMIQENDIDLLIIAPVSIKELIQPLKEIHQKGIEIITVDTFIGNGNYQKTEAVNFPLLYVGTDNVYCGELLGLKLAELIEEKGKVYINSTFPNASSVAGRVQGFVEAMKQFPNIEVLAIDYSHDLEEVSHSQTLNILQQHPDIKAVFGVNVFSGQGVHRAVFDTGLTGAVRVAVWDATKTLVKALKEGKIDMILAQIPSEMGAIATTQGYHHFSENKIIDKKNNPGFLIFTRENVNDATMQKFIY